MPVAQSSSKARSLPTSVRVHPCRRHFFVRQATALSKQPASVAQLFVVNNSNDVDDGVCNAAHCSLREAINEANAAPGHDRIEFAIDAGETITLSGVQLPPVQDELTIEGQAHTLTSIDGHNQSRILSISPTVALTITNLLLTNGARFEGLDEDFGGQF